MCGIVGLVDVKRATAAQALEASVTAMAATLSHRGPDDSGTWVEARSGVALGHRRLSIFDVTAEGHQPMASESGRYLITYNGEIYNFLDLRRELERSGARFRSRSDTEVLLAGVERWGVAGAVERLVGMFAFGLWDRETRTLYLVRDRLGKKPLYFGWHHGMLAFASELRAIERLRGFCGDLDPVAVTLYLRHGCVPAPRSIFAGVQKVWPGTIVSVRGDSGECSTEQFWALERVARDGLAHRLGDDTKAIVSELDSLLRDAVKIRMAADVPLGAFLSGGIDSSLVVAMMQAQSQTPVRTFTIGFHDRGFDEAPNAAAVARHLGTYHTQLYVSEPEVLDAAVRMPSVFDEPFADESQLPTYLVSRLARDQVTVAVSGDGGDEVFGGYSRYPTALRAFRHRAAVPASLRRALADGLGWFPRGWLDAGARAVRSVTRSRHPALVNSEAKLQRLRAMLRSGSDLECYDAMISLWAEPASVMLTTPPQLELPALDLPDGAAEAERLMFADTIDYLPNDILCKVDRASMAVSLELRAPILDHRVLELAWRMPPHLKYQGGEGKLVLKQLAERYVPRPLLDRPKMGFGVPIGAWLRGPLREWAGDLTDAPSLSRVGVFRADVVARMWTEHLAARNDWGKYLWYVVMLQAWRLGAGGR